METLADFILQRGCPEYIHSDNGPEFIAKGLRKWRSSLRVIATYIEPGCPWENEYFESFISRMRDEFLNEELFGNLYEAQVQANHWRLLQWRQTARWTGRETPGAAKHPSNGLMEWNTGRLAV